MLISPAFKVVEHFQGPKGCFCACCKIQMWKSFYQKSLRFVFQCLLDLAGEARGSHSQLVALPACTGWKNTGMFFLLQSSLLHAEGFCISNQYRIALRKVPCSFVCTLYIFLLMGYDFHRNALDSFKFYQNP